MRITTTTTVTTVTMMTATDAVVITMAVHELDALDSVLDGKTVLAEVMEMVLVECEVNALVEG